MWAEVMRVSEHSRKNKVTDDEFGLAGGCAESLRLSESESFDLYRGSASAAVRGIASSGQHYGPFPERQSLSAHQAAEPPPTSHFRHAGNPGRAAISRLRTFRSLLIRFPKHFVPPALITAVALICSLFLIANCQKHAIGPVALGPEDMCSYCKMAISEKQYAAELIDSEGQAFKFDDIGCMANFIKSKKNTVKAVAYFVMDFNERQWTKAENAFYVRSSELSTPMNGGIVAFKSESKAQEAIAKYHGTLLRFADVLKD
jgi:nitrous oxide reductase accessory protein NosL